MTMTCGKQLIVSRDDTVIQAQLTKDQAAFVIDTAALVHGAIIDSAGTVIGPVRAYSTDTGNSWSESVVQFIFSNVVTAPLTDGEASVEIQVNDGGITTWFIDGFTVRTDHIAIDLPVTFTADASTVAVSGASATFTIV
jgi:hypothetical protein